MARVGSYLDPTFVKQGLYFLTFLGCQNGDFNAFFWVFFSGKCMKISKTSNFLKFFKLKFYHQK